jgi:hypothetical protein
MLPRRCVLRKYVISLSIRMKFANVTASMYSQAVHHLVEYLNEFPNISVLVCPQEVCDFVKHLNELC